MMERGGEGGFDLFTYTFLLSWASNFGTSILGLKIRLFWRFSMICLVVLYMKGFCKVSKS